MNTAVKQVEAKQKAKKGITFVIYRNAALFGNVKGKSLEEAKGKLRDEIRKSGDKNGYFEIRDENRRLIPVSI